MKRSYSELITLPSFGDRLAYLQLAGESHPSPRDISNPFYKSKAWLTIRKEIIKRDLGCDLGVLGMDISGPILVHHINPVSQRDLDSMSQLLLDPNNLITTSYDTHNAIHYRKHIAEEVERKPNDTKLW